MSEEDCSIEISDNIVVADDYAIASVVSVKPVLSPPAHQREDLDKSLGFSMSEYYFNHSGKTVQVGLSSGLLIPVPSKSSERYRSFIVRREFYLPRLVANGVNDFLLTHTGPVSNELNDFRELFEKVYRPRDYGTALSLDYEIDYRRLIEQGGSMYVRELNIILGADQDNIPLHPNSEQADLLRHSQLSTSAIHVELIDNLGQTGRRIVRLGNLKVAVTPQKNRNKTDGLRIYYSTPSGRRSSSNNEEKLEYSLEEMDKLPFVFRTLDEAEATPLDDTHSQLELKRLELDSKQLQHLHAREKSEMDQRLRRAEERSAQLNALLSDKERAHKAEMMEADHRRQEIEHEMKIARMRSNDFYESRSAIRKDSTEIIKTTPALILGIGAVVATLIKVMFGKT
jgi:hypothetical protein